MLALASIHAQYVRVWEESIGGKETDRRGSLNISVKCQRDVCIEKYCYATTAVPLKYEVPYGRRSSKRQS
jgi:hypothetical protein